MFMCTQSITIKGLDLPKNDYPGETARYDIRSEKAGSVGFEPTTSGSAGQNHVLTRLRAHPQIPATSK